MKLRSLIQTTRNGRTVHPGESFRVEADEVAGLIDAEEAEPLARDAEAMEVRYFSSAEIVQIEKPDRKVKR